MHDRDADREEKSLIETHISVLFFLSDRVYKLKKPVRYNFADLTERAERERICHREVELNRRLASDVYLGVLDVVDEAGEPRDHLVEMRRLPAERRLEALIDAGADVTDCLRALARKLAAFHASAETSAEISRQGDWSAVRGDWDDNFAEIDRFGDTILDRDALDRIRRAVDVYLEGRPALFEARTAGGHVRDGHGDLSTDDIFCLDDGPRVLDCIEFNDRFRYGDVIADVAFLLMHLRRSAAPELADRFMHLYREFSGEAAPNSLVHHYIAYRALVRSKVACLRDEQAPGVAADEARDLLAMVDDHLERGRIRLVCVGGLPGTGKSTLADGISEATGWTVLRTDEIRKDLAGLGHDEHPGHDFRGGIYTDEMTARTYRTLLDRAGASLEMGSSVVLDASWTDGSWREEARRTAERTSSEIVELECVLPRQMATERLRDRHGDVSDADAEIAARMAAEADPWPESEHISTDTTPEDALTQTRERLGRT